MKIVYCTNSVSGVGGIELVTLAKCNALAAVEGNEVWLIVACPKGRLAIPLNERVHFMSLGIDYFDHDWALPRLKRWKRLLKYRALEKKKLQDVVSRILPDIIISTGSNEKKILPRLRLSHRPVLIVEQHQASNLSRFWSPVDRFISSVSSIEYKLFYRHRFDQVIVLTSEAKWRYSHPEKVTVIPNPLIWEHPRKANFATTKAISAGRLDTMKNYAALIRIWSIVKKHHPDWVLEIYGDGPQKAELERLIEQHGMQNLVFLKGFSNEIISKMSEASLFAFTSLGESFGMVLIEAMSCGLPVVAFDCPDGPKDIITHGQDGFLIPLNDESEMAKKICLLIERDDLRRKMGANAIETSRQYSMDVIIGKYMTLFTTLLDKKV